MDEKSLDEQFDDLLNHPHSNRLFRINSAKKQEYRDYVWPQERDEIKRCVIREVKRIIAKVNYLCDSIIGVLYFQESLIIPNHFVFRVAKCLT